MIGAARRVGQPAIQRHNYQLPVAKRVKIATGFYQSRIEGPCNLGVYRTWFGRGQIVPGMVWGGGEVAKPEPVAEKTAPAAPAVKKSKLSLPLTYGLPIALLTAAKTLFFPLAATLPLVSGATLAGSSSAALLALGLLVNNLVPGLALGLATGAVIHWAVRHATNPLKSGQAGLVLKYGAAVTAAITLKTLFLPLAATVPFFSSIALVGMSAPMLLLAFLANNAIPGLVFGLVIAGGIHWLAARSAKKPAFVPVVQQNHDPAQTKTGKSVPANLIEAHQRLEQLLDSPTADQAEITQLTDFISKDGRSDLIIQGHFRTAAGAIQNVTYSVIPGTDSVATQLIPNGHLVGSGGMAEVYKAYDPASKQYVAIKVLKDMANAQRFAGEYSVPRTLDAAGVPRIVTTYAEGTLANQHNFIAMRFMAFPTLTELRGQLSNDQIVTIAIRLLDTLNNSHNRAVFHRDLKPDNLFVDPETLEIWVGDWGINKELQNLAQTRTGDLAGSEPYMAPCLTKYSNIPQEERARLATMSPEEQAKQPAAIYLRTNDLYAVGAIMYKMITGTPPVWQEGSKKVSIYTPKIDDPAWIDEPRRFMWLSNLLVTYDGAIARGETPPLPITLVGEYIGPHGLVTMPAGLLTIISTLAAFDDRLAFASAFDARVALERWQTTPENARRTSTIGFDPTKLAMPHQPADPAGRPTALDDGLQPTPPADLFLTGDKAKILADLEAVSDLDLTAEQALLYTERLALVRRQYAKDPAVIAAWKQANYILSQIDTAGVS